MPAVRAMMDMPLGYSNWSMFSLSSARSSPSMRRLTPPPRGIVRHQHHIAAGQRHESGERRALVAALFLLDLDQQFLAFPDGVADAGLGNGNALGEVALGDFLERQEAVAIFAVVDEAGFERGLDPRHDGLVDIALALFAPFDFDFVVEELLSIDDRQPAFFRLRGVDQHPLHSVTFFLGKLCAGLSAMTFFKHRTPMTGQRCLADASKRMELPGMRRELPSANSAGVARARGWGRGTGCRKGGPQVPHGVGVQSPRSAGCRRCHAFGGGCEPPPAGHEDRHQHRSSRFDPSAAKCWRTGIPYQCFKVPASTHRLAGHRQHLAGNLRAGDDGGIDLPAWPVAVRGLNSKANQPLTALR